MYTLLGALAFLAFCSFGIPAVRYFKKNVLGWWGAEKPCNTNESNASSPVSLMDLYQKEKYETVPDTQTVNDDSSHDIDQDVEFRQALDHKLTELTSE